ncbi:MAG: CO dehydrogenase/CO-methylating acetyl-CoA synthase complex subunit beta [Candidatus Bathyarchaeia archaeon]
MKIEERPEFPVEIGEVYEGERIRRPEMYLEFGGLNVEKKFELVQARKPEEIEKGKIVIIGPDLKELKPDGSYPLGILIEVAGKGIERDIEGVLERRIHYFLNYIEGVMHVNQRYDIWIRISKKSVQKGLDSLIWLGKALIWLFKTSFPMIEKIQITFYTEDEKLNEMFSKALEVYEARDKRARMLEDEDVDEFYGCVLCQSFAPTHVCVISPNRISLCGSISWFDARAAAKIDPKGPNFPVPKGECLDGVRGIYEGVNRAVQEKSLGALKQISLYSMFDHPHTSCGCFEAIAFYIPEVDGVGIVHRDFKGETVNGLSFSSMAGHISGGTQSEGFNGIAIEYMRSPKFIQADGGWERIVWIPKQIKERVKEAIPENLVARIATEEDVKSIIELKEFLQKNGHPVVKRWEAIRKEEEAVVVEEEAKPEITLELPSASGLPIAGMPVKGGFKIILKNAKIVAEKVIIKRAEEG